MSQFTSIDHLTLVFKNLKIALGPLITDGFYSDELFTKLKSVKFVFMESDIAALEEFNYSAFRHVQCS